MRRANSMAFEKVGDCEVCGIHNVNIEKYGGKYKCCYCFLTNKLNIITVEHFNLMLNLLEKRIVSQIVKQIKGT